MKRLTGDPKGVSMFLTSQEAKIYNRLRQYEDTGLTPDEIAALRVEVERLRAENKEWQQINDSTDFEYKKLRAEMDGYNTDIEAGRLVRYPCRPGDTIWTIWRDIPEMTVHSNHVDCMLDSGEGPVPCKDYDYEGPQAIMGTDGDDYYLTQESAEVARALLGKI